jgi:OOP family OmpA-OmpF porin
VKKIVLRGINFDFDKSNIKPEFTPVLDEGVDILKSNPDVKIVIGGHTDSIGTPEYNQKLSERRAQSVLDYFVKKGIDKNRMKAVGYGETKPIADNKTKDGRALNRRVELQVAQ